MQKEAGEKIEMCEKGGRQCLDVGYEQMIRRGEGGDEGRLTPLG